MKCLYLTLRFAQFSSCEEKLSLIVFPLLLR